jgi:hypothetical protein
VKVAIVIPPHETAGNASTTSVREAVSADELAEAMRAALAIDVPVIETPLTSPLPDGYLLVFHTVPWTIGPELARRIISIDEDRSSIMKNLEQHGFAGAIEKYRYFQWCTKRDDERGYGLVGRKDVATRMPAQIAGGPYTSASYGIIASDTARDLPGLIAEYLKAYDAAP